MAKFEIARHIDPAYGAPAPWDQWDTYAGCWSCRHCGAAAGFQRHNPNCLLDVDVFTCSCYGCTIKRQRAGITAPDRLAEPCKPSDACAMHGQCWTHSKWIDEAACDPPNACARGHACSSHGKSLA